MRCFSRGTAFCSDETNEDSNEITEGASEELNIHPSKDRRKPIPVETSVRYLASDGLFFISKLLISHNYCNSNYLSLFGIIAAKETYYILRK